MKRILIPILLSTLLMVNCSKVNMEPADTYEYFSTHLKATMSYTDIVSVFGHPSDDLGSGIHIYVYPLRDGTAIQIGFTDHILYAMHVDSNGFVLHILI